MPHICTILFIFFNHCIKTMTMQTMKQNRLFPVYQNNDYILHKRKISLYSPYIKTMVMFLICQNNDYTLHIRNYYYIPHILMMIFSIYQNNDYILHKRKISLYSPYIKTMVMFLICQNNDYTLHIRNYYYIPHILMMIFSIYQNND